MFAGFGDFAFYEMKLKGAHLVAGFGRIVDLKPPDLLTDLAGAEALVAAEPERDRAHERRITPTPAGSTRPSCSARRTATGAASAAIRTGSTCNSSGPGLRLPFPQRVTQPGVLRAVLKQMADQARAA